MALGTGRKRSFSIAVAIGIFIFSLAFVVAPHSCEGGLELYFWSGIAATTTLFAIPVATRMGSSFPLSLGWAAVFFTFGVAVWFAGFFLAHIRIICRLW